MVAYHAIRRSGLRLHDRVLVVGGGIIGQLCGELAKKAGASFVALSKVSEARPNTPAGSESSTPTSTATTPAAPSS